MDIDIHNYRYRLAREEDLLRRSRINEKNKKLILKFKKELRAQGISIARIVRYMQTLRGISQIVNKPFDEWGRDEIIEVLNEIESRDYTVQTKNEFRKGMRKFFRWLKGEDWRPLKVLKGDKKDDRIPQILNDEEIKRMIEAAEHPRDKAFIAVLYEAGLRIGEIASLRLDDVTWNDKGALIRVRGKTGERIIPIVIGASYLRRWLDVHPGGELVFCSISQRNFKQPLSYQTLRKIIIEAAKKAGIKKKVHPHMLRHSRATKLATIFPEAIQNQYFGWVQGSDMPRIYHHLSAKDLEKAVYAMYGIESEEEEVIKPIECPRCGHINAPTDKYCSRCALILDESERLKMEMLEGKNAMNLLSKAMAREDFFEKLEEMIAFVEEMRRNPEIMKMVMQLKRGR